MVKEEEQLKAVGYCRVVASDHDADRRFAEQDGSIDRFVIMARMEFAECFHEIGKAGETLEEAYEFCKHWNDISYLVVTDFSRISRDAKEFKAWEDKFLELGVEVVDATEHSLVNVFGDDFIRSQGQLTRKVRG
jgi:DNA invertase Pin-like site-specific DNA recombinase